MAKPEGVTAKRVTKNKIKPKISNPKAVKAPKPEGCDKCGVNPHLMLYADGSVAEARLICKHKKYVRNYEPQEMGVPGNYDRSLLWDTRVAHLPLVD